MQASRLTPARSKAVKPDGPSDADRHTATLLGELSIDGIEQRFSLRARLAEAVSTFPPYFHLSLPFIVSKSRPLARFGGICSSHIRSTDSLEDPGQAQEAFGETRIASCASHPRPVLSPITTVLWRRLVVRHVLCRIATTSVSYLGRRRHRVCASSLLPAS